jgi:peptidoglycan/LPS O-acetylase OafA/YrhL
MRPRHRATLNRDRTRYLVAAAWALDLVATRTLPVSSHPPSRPCRRGRGVRVLAAGRPSPSDAVAVAPFLIKGGGHGTVWLLSSWRQNFVEGGLISARTLAFPIGRAVRALLFRGAAKARAASGSWMLRNLVRRRQDSTATPRPQREYRSDLQGLRAVAVLLVALDHAGVGFLSGGYVGVDVFFVISGFLITGLLVQGAERDGHVSFRNFYARRARRILPAAALTLVVTTIVANLLLNYVRAKQVAWDSFWAGLFAANIRFAHEGTNYLLQSQPPSPIQHFWSLSIEEQFYLVWPALLSATLFGLWRKLRGRSVHAVRDGGLTGRARMRALVVVVILGLASLWWSIHYTDVLPAAAYFSTRTRVWELALGAALALAAPSFEQMPRVPRALLGWLGLAAIAGAATEFSARTPFPSYFALLPTVGAAFVIASGIGRKQGGPRGWQNARRSSAPLCRRQIV